MEAQHFISYLSVHDLLWERFTFTPFPLFKMPTTVHTALSNKCAQNNTKSIIAIYIVITNNRFTISVSQSIVLGYDDFRNVVLEKDGEDQLD
jgi:hypothetical protein